MNRKDPKNVAFQLLHEKFNDADCLLLAGSVMRGEGTDSSDLDIVVLYSNLEASWRDAFYFGNWPVEVFVHDLETLNYFFEKFDRPGGVPILQNMVFEGLEVPGPTEISKKAKEMASQSITMGPPPLNEKQILRYRYGVTDLCEDMRAPSSKAELVASATKLYSLLTDFYFRSQGKWSANGKSIPKRWKTEDEGLATRFIESFDQVFRNQDPSRIIQFSKEILEPHGGWCFENTKTVSSPELRLPLGR